MKKKLSIKKASLMLFILITCMGIAFGFYEYNRGVPEIAKLEAVSVTADNLFNKFSANEQQANELYVNKVLQVRGTVLEVKPNRQGPSQIILDAGDPMFGIACTLENFSKPVKAGDQVIIKGVCSGYLNDVILIRSLLVN